MPPEIAAAIPLLRQLLGAMGVPVFSVAGVEADDVLGTLAVRGVPVRAAAACTAHRPGA
jgi:DNA polymerase-1